MGARFFNVLLFAAVMASAGCSTVKDYSLTGRLWRNGNYVQPMPDPKLAVDQTPRGYLVQYTDYSESGSTPTRVAYLLEPNVNRIAAHQAPVFVQPARINSRESIPIYLEKQPVNHPADYVIYTAKTSEFSIYKGGMIFGPCTLPCFKDPHDRFKQIALTPLAVTGDAAIVGYFAGCVWALCHSSGYDPANY